MTSSTQQRTYNVFGFLKKLFGSSKAARPNKSEIKKVGETGKSLEKKREALYYEAVSLETEIKDLYEKYQNAESKIQKAEYTRSLTIKKAEFDSLSARLDRLGEAAVANTRRSAFMQSFLDLPEITEEDLDRLEELQEERQQQERRSAMYADRVIELTEMAPETSMEAQRLQKETLEELEAEAKEAEAKKAAAEKKKELPAETLEKIEGELKDSDEKKEAEPAEVKKEATSAEQPDEERSENA
jgi:hypothetical protein